MPPMINFIFGAQNSQDSLARVELCRFWTNIQRAVSQKRLQITI